MKLALAILVIFSAAFPSAWARADGNPLPTLSRHNKIYDSACTQQNQKELRSSLDELEVKSKDEAWKAITVLLCAEPSNQNKRYVANLMSKKIQLSSGGIDADPTPKLVNSARLRADDLFAQAISFNARIADSPNELKIIYYRDEACVRSKKLNFIGNRWRLTAVGGACD